VHLGAPDSNAPNVTVPFADYIKNVASSEIYPTWPENAIRANVYAQVSYTLNRIYTDYYRSRGYDFDITNSTTYDQSFVNGRNIYENIEQISSEIFNSYVRRQGNVEPLFTAYCDGIKVQCNGLSQWGSLELANSGYTPYEILKYYYGDDIDIVTNVSIDGMDSSAPTIPLTVGSSGDDVRVLQLRLNRISNNYPSIPKIAALDGVFAGGIGTTYNIIPKHFSEICRLAAANDFKSAAKWQDEANQVVRLMIESDNWSYRKAMMKYIGIDCGPYRAPFETLTPAQEKSYLKRFAALGIAKRNQAICPKG
jgi:hypothetical protein